MKARFDKNSIAILIVLTIISIFTAIWLISAPLAQAQGVAPMIPPQTSPAKQEPRVIRFSGLDWVLKNAAEPVGPGRNRFTDKEQDIWVDKEGKLHLKIVFRDGQWHSSELWTKKPLGYGTYAFTLANRVDTLDRNVVLGLYTWDNNTFDEGANNEIDIEVSRWGYLEQRNLQFSVQPTRGPDEESKRYPERYQEVEWAQKQDHSTHLFRWLPQKIEFATFDGKVDVSPTAPLKQSGKNLVTSKEFDHTNPARRAQEGEVISQPVLIPRPTETTHARINLWLCDTNNDGQGDAPFNGQEVEVIVESFRFIPAK
jgi:hypothetical protein